MRNLISIVRCFLKRCYRFWKTFLWYFIFPLKTRILALFWGIKCGRNVRFMGRTIIRTHEKNSICVGNDVIFNSLDNINLVGLTGPTILCTSKDSKIIIGNGSGFSSVVLNSRGLIQIGDNVNIGGNVRIFDHDFHPLEWWARRKPEQIEKTRVSPVVIGDDVFVGTNAIILKGTRIGARSIVAAGSVIFGLDIPPDSIVKGNPAIIVKRNLPQK